VSATRVSTDIKAQVERLHAFDLTPSKLESALDTASIPAFGTNTSAQAIVELPEFACSGLEKQSAADHAKELKLKEFYRLLMRASGTKSLEAALVKPKETIRSTLIEKTDFAALLLLMWRTEEYIHLSLPLLATYVERRPNFSPDDDYPQSFTKALALSDAERQQYGSYLAAATPGAEGAVGSLLDQVRLGTLEAIAGPDEAKQATTFKPSEHALIEKALSDIESAKAQMKMIRSLSSDDSVSLADIQAYLRKDIFMPESGGMYHVGTIGQPARFVCPNGKVISIRR
jgi:hypothetical protein